MAWDGWFSFDGNEVINVARTEAYAHNAGVGWFHPQYNNDSLAPILGDGLRYSSALQDWPDWADEDVIESFDFYGVYPLDVTGIEDSSRQATAIESIRDGGTAGRLRHGTKTIVFNVALVGGSDAAVDYGFKWLKRALLGAPCGAGGACDGADLCYLSSEPEIDLRTLVIGQTSAPVELVIYDGGTPGFTGSIVDGGDPDATGTDVIEGDTEGQFVDTFDGGTPSAPGGTVWDGGDPTGPTDTDIDGGDPGDPIVVVPDDDTAGFVDSAEECLPPYLRSLRRVQFSTGPTITAKRVTADGGAVWTATFTAVAGVPWEFGAEVRVIEGFLDPNRDDPLVEPGRGEVDREGFIFTDQPCAVHVFQPIYDPLCPAVIPPPLPPSVPLGCYKPPVNWRRRQITVPKQYVPLWGDVVPMLRIHAPSGGTRNVRLRFYADPDGNGAIAEDPCAYCGDIVVSYIPGNCTLIVDGVTETIWVETPGGVRRRADSLLFKTDGTPFDWPALSCGFGFIVTVDMPQYHDAPEHRPPILDMSLYARAV